MSKRYIDRFPIWHTEEYYASRQHVFTERQLEVKEVALKIKELDRKAESYIVKYLNKRKALEKEMRDK